MLSRAVLFVVLCLLAIALSCGGEDAAFDWDRDGTPDTDDCQPEDPYSFPGADEMCDDGADNDCDGAVDCLDDDCFEEDHCETDTDGDDDDTVGVPDDDDSGDDDTGDDDTDQPPAANLVFDGFTVSDMVGGDGDGVIEVGETIEVGIAVRNDGETATDPSVVGEVGLEHSGDVTATLLIATISYNDAEPVEPAQTVEHDPLVGIRIDDGAEGGELQLRLELIDGSGRMWNPSLDALVIGP